MKRMKKGLMSSVNYDKWVALGKKLRDKLPYGSINKNKHRIIPSQSINWKKTKAFAEGTFGYIFINLKGRDPQGIVNPGKEYDELCDRIMEGLKTVRDPENGRLVVEDVFRREEIFSGSYEDNAPDLIITSRQNYFVTASNERFSRIQEKRGRSHSMFQKHTWSGNHVPDGIFIINGPNIKRACKIQGARIIDIAPTTLYLLAQEIPRDMDGEVLLDAFNSEHTETNPPKFKEADHVDKDNKSLGELLPEEDEKVKERLRNLGYLD